MEHTSLEQDFRSLQQKAQVVGSLLLALHEQRLHALANTAIATEQYIIALQSIWAELEGSMQAVGEHIDYLHTLSHSNNIPELLFALQPHNPQPAGK